jgi:hypothetical protein
MSTANPPLGIIGMPLLDVNHRSKWFVYNYIEGFDAGKIMVFEVTP